MTGVEMGKETDKNDRLHFSQLGNHSASPNDTFAFFLKILNLSH